MIELLALALAAGSPDVVSLSCVVGENNAHMDFLLYEAEGRATYDVRETGKSFQEEAIFTPTQVIIGSRYPELRTVIDRTTLEYSQGQQYNGQFVGRRGTCEVTKPPENRKF
jgi:hypothetical protein